MVRIVISTRLAELYGKQIREVDAANVILLPVHGGDPADLGVGDAEVAVNGCLDGPMSFAELIREMPQLRWIHSTGAGIDDFASVELLQRQIFVTNSSGLYAPSMVEYVVAMLVMVLRGLPEWLDSQRRHVWLQATPTVGGELRGRRAGIVGYGGVGRHLASVFEALGTEVWAIGRQAATGSPKVGLTRFLTPDCLADLLENSDFIILACPLT